MLDHLYHRGPSITLGPGINCTTRKAKPKDDPNSLILKITSASCVIYGKHSHLGPVVYRFGKYCTVLCRESN